MKIDIYSFITLRKQKFLILMNFYTFLILFLCSIRVTSERGPFSSSSETKNIVPLKNETYFDNIIKFDRGRYQVGNFATNKNGDLILELYENTVTTSKRLFYGLTKEGNYLFYDEPFYTHENIVESNTNTQRVVDSNEKSNSFNLFVSIENKEYLLAFNSYKTWIEAELYDLKNEYHKWNFNDLFDYGGDINDYEFIMFELKNYLSYFMVCIPKSNKNNNKFIKKFNFISNNKPYNEIKVKGFEEFLNNKIINVFFMDDFEILVIFYAENEKENSINLEGGNGLGGLDGDQPQVINPAPAADNRRMEIYQNYNFKLYDQNLSDLSCQNEIIFPFEGNELFFFKSLYLGRNYAIFAYIFGRDSQLIFFHLIKIDDIDGTNDKEVNGINKVDVNLFNFDINKTLSDFVKIDDRQILFIYNGSCMENKLLSIIILDINPDDSFSLSTRVYNIDLGNLEPILQLSSFCFDGYLLLATTVKEENSINNNIENIDYYSLLIMFGYSKGINKTIDISYYL